MALRGDARQQRAEDGSGGGRRGAPAIGFTAMLGIRAAVFNLGESWGMACRAGPGPAVLRGDRGAHRRRVERTSRPTSSAGARCSTGRSPGTESVLISCVPPAPGSTGCRTGRPRPFRSPSIASLSEAVRRHRRLGRSKGSSSRIQRSSRSSRTLRIGPRGLRVRRRCSGQRPRGGGGWSRASHRLHVAADLRSRLLEIDVLT